MVTSIIRPSFVNIDGISAPGPFGGNIRSMIIDLDAKEMSARGLTADDILQAMGKNNFPSPAGNILIGETNFTAPVNTLQLDSEDFMNTPIKSGQGHTTFIRDVATVKDASDKTTGYALANGKRTVYLPVIKKSDASTLSAINNLKNALPDLQDQLPEDVSMKFVFDQSNYIVNALSNLLTEGALGAILTGLMVLLFLGDTRGAFIVILTIPISLLTAVIALFLMGQTINIMTLSGLALSIGILVDEATVTIENIHQHFEQDKSKQRAILDALFEISVPKLLILLSILAVLTPSLMMVGIPKDMFMPLSIAVGSAMIASFLASQTFVPVMANWLMKHNPGKKERKKETKFDRIKERYLSIINRNQRKGSWIFILYILVVTTLAGFLFTGIGTDILPPSDSRDLQVRIKAEDGTDLEKTEEYILAVEDYVKNKIAPKQLEVTSAFVGFHSPNTPINGIFLFTSGSHEGVLQFTLPKDLKQSVAGFKSDLRKDLNKEFPDLEFVFEPMELVEKIMGQGHNTPINIEVLGKDLEEVKIYSNKIKNELSQADYLTDLRINEPVDYPSISIHIDRERVAQLGLSLTDVSAVLTTATSSSRFVNKNLWVDPNSGLVFQVQVQLPEYAINSLNELRNLPLASGKNPPILEDVAKLEQTTEPGQVNRKGPNRYMTVSANLNNLDLGKTYQKVQNTLNDMEEPPRGYRVNMIGESQLLKETLSGLEAGLLIAIVVIFLLMTAYYQSFKTSLVIVSVVPAVVAGSLLSLKLLGSTLNLQSYMGMIMAVGVSVSNSVLIIDQAEIARRKLFQASPAAAVSAVKARFRPILMTTLAMTAGMIPMALGLGEGGAQIAPLGQAVIGGLLFSSLAALLILPFTYIIAFRNSRPKNVSMDPNDEESSFYEGTLIE